MDDIYPMCSKITKYPQDIFYNTNCEGLICNNLDTNQYENYEFNNLEEYSKYLKLYGENEKDKVNNISFENDLINKKIQKKNELIKPLIQSEDIKLIVQKNVMQSTTKPTTNNNIEKIDLIISQNDKMQEIELKLLNKKTKEPNQQYNNEKNDKGDKRFNILTKFKTQFFINIQKNLVDKLKEKSEFCKIRNIYLNKIDSKVYIISKASENLDLLDLELKEVYSMNDKHNEEVINAIINANDSPLCNVLQQKIKNLIHIFIGIATPKENYYFDFINSYKNVINKIRIKKEPQYVENFIYFAKNIEVEYNNINKHARSKRGNKKK